MILEFRTLGTIDLRRPSGARPRALLQAPKRLALLAYLLLGRPRSPRRRDTLLALFWPESDLRRARGALRSTLHLLRRDLGAGVLVTGGGETVAIAEGTIRCDAVEFEAAIEAGRQEEALELYGGDLLEGLFAPGVAPEFQRWLEQERRILRRRAAGAAWSLAVERRASQDVDAAVSWAWRAADLAPLEETALRRLMEFLERVGDRAGAIRAYERFAARLEAEMELTPCAQSQALAERLRAPH